MATHFTLAHPQDSGCNTDCAEETLWFFQIAYTDVCDLACQLTQLVSDPISYITEKLEGEGCNPATFLDCNSISLVFEYGPFMGPGEYGAWCVHGMDNTNVVSIRCPPISTIASLSLLDGCPPCPKPLANISLTALDVTYLLDPAIAFAHVCTSPDWLQTNLPGYLIAFPRCCPGFINTSMSNTDFCLSIKEAVPCTDKKDNHAKQTYSKVKFVLGSSFRFRYEWFPTLSQDGKKCPSTSQQNTQDDQCIKFAGVYDEGGDENGDPEILISIDEAWSLRWQENTSSTGSPDK